MERERDLLRAGTRRLRLRPAAAPSLIGAVGGSPASLAARKPGGTAWGAGEVPMWKRSQVEQLTGLTRHTIQDLCNPNTAGDGLGFWRPAVSKPGYSRFDEGDLLAFYLVRQLTKAGFTLREVEPAVFDLLETDDAFALTVRAKESRLRARRSELDGKLDALACLERAAAHAAGERLFSVMEEALLRSAGRAAMSAGERDAAHPDIAGVHAVLEGLVRQMLLVLRGEDACPAFDLLRRRIGELASDDPESPSAEHTLWELVDAVRYGGGAAARVADASAVRASAEEHGAQAQGPADAPADEGEPGDGELRFRGGDRLAMRALARFLKEAENGVPVELVFGEGSFSFLARAAAACADRFEEEVHDDGGDGSDG